MAPARNVCYEASTSTKNVRYRDVRYVEELIGRDTVTTVIPKTIAAVRDHGRPRASLEEDLDDAHRLVETLISLARYSVGIVWTASGSVAIR